MSSLFDSQDARLMVVASTPQQLPDDPLSTSLDTQQLVAEGSKGSRVSPAVRLPPAARQEYENYVQERLKQAKLQNPLVAVRTTLLQGVGSGWLLDWREITMTYCLQDENNPFSESYQQREKKLQQQALSEKSGEMIRCCIV